MRFTAAALMTAALALTSSSNSPFLAAAAPTGSSSDLCSQSPKPDCQAMKAVCFGCTSADLSCVSNPNCEWCRACDPGFSPPAAAPSPAAGGYSA